jgi:hypothetical protein
MASKRSLETDDAETHNSPQYTTERPKTSTFNALAIGKMGYNFELPETMTVLRNKMHEPWKLGFAVGVMLYHISPLLSTHLNNAVDFQNPVPGALTSLPDFISAIDQYIAYLCLTDGCTKKVSMDIGIDRKGWKPRRRYMERYTFMVEAGYKNHIRGALGDVFRTWYVEQTRLFNKSIDKALSGTQWVVYPVNDVVAEAGVRSWAWRKRKRDGGCWRTCRAVGVRSVDTSFVVSAVPMPSSGSWSHGGAPFPGV